jgi:hypothetical protein
MPDGSPAKKWAVVKELTFWLSLANLLFVRVWVELLTFTPANAFFMRQLPQPVHYLAAVSGVLLLGGILGGLSVWVRSRRSRSLTVAMTWLKVLLMILVANQLRRAAYAMIPGLHSWLMLQPLLARLGWTGITLVGIAGCILLGRIAALYRGRWISGIALVVFVAWPLVPLTLGQALWRSQHAPQLARLGQPHTRGDPGGDGLKDGASRVVWVLFDEWDYRLTFEDRPRDLVTPELEALAGESLAARRAYTAGSETTVSIPSLATGQVIGDLTAVGDDDAEVTVAPDFIKRRLRGLDSVFADIHRQGITTAVVGWHLPYCRIWGEALDYCEWQEMDGVRVMRAETLGESVEDSFRSFLETGVLSPLGVSPTAERERRTCQKLVAASESVLRDKRYRFVFLHLPIPHGPFYYDRRTGGTRKGNNYVTGYIDHLALLDRTLGMLVNALRESGSWENTALLISSDHSFRNARALDGKWDRRVPFLLRIPHSKGKMVAEFAFSTQVSRRLVTDLLSGRIGTQRAAVALLQNHSGQPECRPADPGRASR